MPPTAGDAGDVLGAARAELDAAGVEPEYLEVLAADDLSAPRVGPGERAWSPSRRRSAPPG